MQNPVSLPEALAVIAIHRHTLDVCLTAIPPMKDKIQKLEVENVALKGALKLADFCQECRNCPKQEV